MHNRRRENTMKDILRKIRALHNTNVEIIQRVEGKEKIKWSSYEEQWDEKHALSVVEKVRSTTIERFLAKWSSEVDMETNLLVLHGTTLQADLTLLSSSSPPTLSWDSAKLMNENMIESVEKVAALLDVRKDGTETELRKYLRNFEILQVAFGHAEEESLDQTSQLAEYQKLVKRVNDAREVYQSSARRSRKRTLDYMTDTFILSLAEESLLKEWYCSDPSRGQLNLLYRGSRDGWEATMFHELCDNQGPTIVLIQTKEGYKCGGYTTASWKASDGKRHPECYAACNQASLFTLTNPDNVPAQRFRVKEPNVHEAIEADPFMGPAFGYDLCIGTDGELYQVATYLGEVYRRPPGVRRTLLTGTSGPITIEELEVFKVI